MKKKFIVPMALLLALAGTLSLSACGAGPKGDSGLPGEKGEKGDKGDSGAKGDKGDSGEKGEKGDSGAKGDSGPKGDSGAKGDKGDSGEKGDKGDSGAKGDKGDSGAKGDKGDSGEKGEKGDSGAKGDSGPKGDPGETTWSNTIVSPEHGTITCNECRGSFKVGEDVSFTLTLFGDYELDYFLVNGEQVLPTADNVTVEGNVITIELKMVEGGIYIEAVTKQYWRSYANDSEITFLFDDYSSDDYGFANLYMLAPNQYYYTDENIGYQTKGLKKGDEGLVSVGTVALNGDSQVVRFNRFDSTGYDRIYNKFYLAKEDEVFQGPMWVTEFDSVNDSYITKLSTYKTLKGVEPQGTNYTKIQIEDDSGTLTNLGNHAINTKFITDYGGATTRFDFKLCDFILSNESSDTSCYQGNVSAENKIAFESNGQTYYFKKTTVDDLDSRMKEYAKRKVRSDMIMLMPHYNIPSAMLYPGVLDLKAKSNNLGNKEWGGNINAGTYTAPNSLSDLGYRYWIAIIEFLSSRYTSGEFGGLEAIQIGNEIDFAGVWNANMDYCAFEKSTGQKMPDMEDYAEENYRTLRLAANAAKKYSVDLVMLESFTHHWNMTAAEIDHELDPHNALYNSDGNYAYRPKDLCDYFLNKSLEQGNIYWGLAPHPYGARTQVSDIWSVDLDYPTYVNGNLDTGYLTYGNFEVLDQYLKQDYALCNGKIRPVCLMESGVSGYDEYSLANEHPYTKCPGAAYESRRYDETYGWVQANQQALGFMYFFMKVYTMDSVISYPFYVLTDHEDGEANNGLAQGLWSFDGEHPKKMFEIWKDIEVMEWADLLTKYKDVIPGYNDSAAQGGVNTKFKFTTEDTIVTVFEKVAHAYGTDAFIDWSEVLNRVFGI